MRQRNDERFAIRITKDSARKEREKGEKVFVTSSFPTELVVLTTARHFEPAKRTRVEGPVEKDRKGVEGDGEGEKIRGFREDTAPRYKPLP